MIDINETFNIDKTQNQCTAFFYGILYCTNKPAILIGWRIYKDDGGDSINSHLR